VDRDIKALTMVALTILIVGGIILVCGGYYWLTQMIQRPEQPTVARPYSGPVDLTVYTSNSFNVTERISLTVYWYKYRMGVYQYIGTGNTSITLEEADHGTLYMVVKGGSDYYVDDAKIMANTYVNTITYVDIDEDGYKEHVFEVFLPYTIKPDVDVVPEVSFSVYGIPVDDSITLNSPSDITVSGVGEEYINWKLIWSDRNLAIKIAYIYITTNATDTSEIDVRRVDSVIGTFAPEWNEAQQRWYVYGTSNIEEVDAKLVAYKRGMNPDFAYFTVILKYRNLSAAYSLTIHIRIVLPDNSYLDLTDTVVISA